MKRVVSLALLIGLSACNCGGVGSEEEARIAYLGVDTVITRALALGFDGYNAADSANIAAQSADGDESGKVTVSGTIDHGSSDNKGMRLDVVLTEFSDGAIDDPETDEEEEFAIVYETADGDPIVCEMKLRGIPDGTLEDGTFKGVVIMSGDIEGDLELDVTFSGELEEDPDNAGGSVRAEGTTEVTGTATSGAGEFEIDTTI
jgi:hypothetical protein